VRLFSLFFIHLKFKGHKINLILTARMTAFSPLTKDLCVFCITRDKCELVMRIKIRSDSRREKEIKTERDDSCRDDRQTNQRKFGRSAAGQYIII